MKITLELSSQGYLYIDVTPHKFIRLILVITTPLSRTG